MCVRVCMAVVSTHARSTDNSINKNNSFAEIDKTKLLAINFVNSFKWSYLYVLHTNTRGCERVRLCAGMYGTYSDFDDLKILAMCIIVTLVVDVSGGGGGDL